MIIGTWVTEEMKKAVEKGYKIIKVSQVLVKCLFLIFPYFLKVCSRIILKLLLITFYLFSFQMYEVYHFSKTSNELFRSYIDLFLKIKQEASGWPYHCITEEDKITYLENYAEKEGISLNPDSISVNPGRRQVSKLALNSFWGR